MKGLDEVDVQLLGLLQNDGRITNADLAKAVGLAAPTVLARVRNLEKLGLIKTYTALLDAEKLGLKLTAMVQISLALHQDQPIERFRRAVQEFPEILECYHVSGDFDFLIKVQVRDMRAYELFIREKLSKIKGLGKIQTCFVFGTPKHTTKIQL